MQEFVINKLTIAEKRKLISEIFADPELASLPDRELARRYPQLSKTYFCSKRRELAPHTVGVPRSVKRKGNQDYVMRIPAPRQKAGWGGARNVKWTPQRRAQFLTTYEDVLAKINSGGDGLPDGVKEQASLRGNKPSDVAREYTASLLGVKPGDYLQRVLALARKEKKGPPSDVQDES